MDKITLDTLFHQASLLDQMARKLCLRSGLDPITNQLLISDKDIACVLK